MIACKIEGLPFKSIVRLCTEQVIANLGVQESFDETMIYTCMEQQGFTRYPVGQFFVWKPRFFVSPNLNAFGRPSQQVRPKIESAEKSPTISQPQNLGDLLSTLLNSADSIFNDINFLKLKHVQSLSNWRVVDANGQSYMTDIDIGYDPNFGRVNQYCTTLLQQIFRGPSHTACGCTMPKPPWRAVVIERPDPQHGCGQGTNFVVAHELWHLKGYWTHTPDGQWPADVKTGRVPPRRMTRADE
jgi:hypothetical protein